MKISSRISRCKFANLSAAAVGAVASRKLWLPRAAAAALASAPPLAEFGYGDVTISSALHEAQWAALVDADSSIGRRANRKASVGRHCRPRPNKTAALCRDR